MRRSFASFVPVTYFVVFLLKRLARLSLVRMKGGGVQSSLAAQSGRFEVMSKAAKYIKMCLFVLRQPEA